MDDQSINEINFHRLTYWHASIMEDEYGMVKNHLSIQSKWLILPLRMTGINESLIWINYSMIWHATKMNWILQFEITEMFEQKKWFHLIAIDWTNWFALNSFYHTNDSNIIK